MTRQEEVLRVLSDGKFHPTHHFHNPKTGSSGDRRLRELRAKGYPIEKRKRQGSAEWEYRLERENCTGVLPGFRQVFTAGKR